MVGPVGKFCNRCYSYLTSITWKHYGGLSLAAYKNPNSLYVGQCKLRSDLPHVITTGPGVLQVHAHLQYWLSLFCCINMSSVKPVDVCILYQIQEHDGNVGHTSVKTIHPSLMTAWWRDWATVAWLSGRQLFSSLTFQQLIIIVCVSSWWRGSPYVCGARWEPDTWYTETGCSHGGFPQ